MTSRIDDWLGYPRPLSDAEREVRIRLLDREAEVLAARGKWEAAAEVRAEAATLKADSP